MLVCSLFTGCVHHQNLKDLVIIEGMAIDQSKQNVKVTVQSLNVGMSSGVEKPQGNMTVTSESEGKTIIDAVSNMSKSMSKEVFFGNNKIILFGRETCENNFKDEIDYFLRSVDSRADVAVGMVDGEASEMLESKENDAHVPAENIVNLINTGQETGHSIYLVTEDLLNCYSDKTTDMYMPVLKINKKSKNAELSGIAIFSGDKLSYILNDEETLGFLLINGKIKDCIIEFEDQKFGKVGVQVNTPETKRKIVTEDGNITFYIRLKGKLIINEMEKGILKTLGQEDMDSITMQAENEVKGLCINAFESCRKHKSDSLRVGEYLARDYPDAYKELSDEWEKHYERVSMSVDVDLQLKKLSDNTRLD